MGCLVSAATHVTDNARRNASDAKAWCKQLLCLLQAAVNTNVLPSNQCLLWAHASLVPQLAGTFADAFNTSILECNGTRNTMRMLVVMVATWASSALFTCPRRGFTLVLLLLLVHQHPSLVLWLPR